MKEREISLRDIVFECSFKWRQIIIAMIVGALVIGSLGYVRAKKSVEVNQSELARLEQELQNLQKSHSNEDEYEYDGSSPMKDWLEEQMTDLQIANVQNVIETEKLLRDKQVYIENTNYMKFNATAVPKAEVTFLISSDNIEDTYRIQRVYEDLLYSGELIEWIVNNSEGFCLQSVREFWGLEKPYSSTPEGTDIVCIYILYPNEAECKQLQDLTIQFVKERHDELVKTIGKHEISVLSSSLTKIIDYSILNQQKLLTSEVTSLRTTIASMKATFTEVDKQYYSYLTKGRYEKEGEEDIKGSVITEDEQILLDRIQNLRSTNNSGFSMKMVLFGIILGVLIICGATFLTIIFNTKLRAEDDIERMFGISSLGVVDQEPKSKKFLYVIDKWLISIRDRNKRKFSYNEAISLTATSIKIAGKRNHLEQIYFIGSNLGDSTQKICMQIKDILQDSGIEVVILNNVLYDAEAMEALHEAEGVVLIETVNVTLYDEISKEIALLNRQGINILGGVVII